MRGPIVSCMENCQSCNQNFKIHFKLSYQIKHNMVVMSLPKIQTEKLYSSKVKFHVLKSTEYYTVR